MTDFHTRFDWGFLLQDEGTIFFSLKFEGHRVGGPVLVPYTRNVGFLVKGVPYVEGVLYMN